MTPRFFPFRLIFLALLALMSVLPSSDADAVSCAPLEDRYFMRCDAGKCSPGFRAKDIPSGIACGRRVVVESFPEWARQPLTERIRSINRPESIDGIYQVSLRHRFFGRPPENANGFDQSLSDSRYPIQVQQVSAIREGSQIVSLRTDWQSRADKELLGEWASYFLDLGITLVLLLVLYRSVSRYVYNVRLFFSQERASRDIWKSLLVQVGIFLFGFVGSVYALGYYSNLFIVLLAPIALSVWLFEAGIYAYLWGKQFLTAGTEI